MHRKLIRQIQIALTDLEVIFSEAKRFNKNDVFSVSYCLTHLSLIKKSLTAQKLPSETTNTVYGSLTCERLHYVIHLVNYDSQNESRETVVEK